MQAQLQAPNLALKLLDKREYARRLVPASKISSVVQRRLDQVWTIDAFREQQEGQMRYLLEFTDRADEAPALARGFAEHSLTRSYLRWHPELVTNQEVRGAEWLTSRRDPSRSIILSFMHHNRYDGLFGSLRRVGVELEILTSPLILARNTLTAYKQHTKVIRLGGTVIPAEGGAAQIQAHLQPGRILAIAPDVPGHTEVDFLGRRVLASFGTALMASRTNSQVVLATHRRDEGGAWIQIHEPLEPSDFAEPVDLLQEVLRGHGEAVLAWPEALEMPRARWGIVQE
ncbi:hypothetical protein [Nocardioides daejeonensis]|uniref:LpxL/LpxP family acyltransferase n=1 Tax=Nocardioides daejeonensis TaxID=1046556 RepID=UPI000D748839|nr:hypothetical protein [Nocardioides daejeonensis]